MRLWHVITQFLPTMRPDGNAALAALNPRSAADENVFIINGSSVPSLTQLIGQLNGPVVINTTQAANQLAQLGIMVPAAATDAEIVMIEGDEMKDGCQNGTAVQYTVDSGISGAVCAPSSGIAMLGADFLTLATLDSPHGALEGDNHKELCQKACAVCCLAAMLLYPICLAICMPQCKDPWMPDNGA